MGEELEALVDPLGVPYHLRRQRPRGQTAATGLPCVAMSAASARDKSTNACAAAER